MGRRAAVGGLVAGGLAVTVNYVDGFTDVRVLAFLAIVWALGVWLVGRNVEAVRGSDSGAKTLFIVLVAGLPPLAVHDGLPLPEGVRAALWFLVVGVALAAGGVGVEIGRSESAE
jgi:hypothetical protein